MSEPAADKTPEQKLGREPTPNAPPCLFIATRNSSKAMSSKDHFTIMMASVALANMSGEHLAQSTRHTAMKVASFLPCIESQICFATDQLTDAGWDTQISNRVAVAIEGVGDSPWIGLSNGADQRAEHPNLIPDARAYELSSTHARDRPLRVVDRQRLLLCRPL